MEAVKVQTKFRSEINRPRPHQYAQGGFRLDMDLYEELIDKHTGKLNFEITDKIPFDDQIQEHESSVSLASLLERYKIDLSKKVLKKISDDILDMTIMPQDAIECYSMIHEAERNFEDTTKEFKAEFNSDFGEYLKGFSTGKTQEVVNKYNKNLITPDIAQNMASTTQTTTNVQPSTQVVQTSATTQNTQQGVNLNV